MPRKLLKIVPADNVAVALHPISAGELVRLEGDELRVVDDIKPGHKVALRALHAGEDVIKYGAPIGHALTDIAHGAWVHSHNLKTNLQGILEYSYTPGDITQQREECPRKFAGYLRPDGQVGVRNEVWIINTVGCVNKVAEALAREANDTFAGRHIDGVYQFSHPYGCSQLGEDHVATQQLLADLVRHPNAGAVLVLGLGCENNNIAAFQQLLGPVDERRVKFLNAQDVSDEIEVGLELLAELVRYAERFTREPVPVSKLKIGLKCGGSDGFSGITGNPLVGEFSDLLTRYGGTSILTEVPEMFGAETLLMNRCVNAEVFAKTVAMVNDFKAYFQKYGQEIYENPSPGNKDGGITTLEEKSLGCTQKGGHGPVVDVLPYGAQVVTPGLNLLAGPGNDMVAVTALAAAGAQIVLFTTGRGTPLGSPVPTVKISTNSDLATRKPKWIDFNAGALLQGKSMAETLDSLFDTVLNVASGATQTVNEAQDYREIAIFKDGVTL